MYHVPLGAGSMHEQALSDYRPPFPPPCLMTGRTGEDQCAAVPHTVIYYKAMQATGSLLRVSQIHACGMLPPSCVLRKQWERSLA